MASVSRPGFQHTDLTLIPQMTLKANWLHLEPVNVTKYMEMGGGNRRLVPVNFAVWSRG